MQSKVVEVATDDDEDLQEVVLHQLLRLRGAADREKASMDFVKFCIDSNSTQSSINLGLHRPIRPWPRGGPNDVHCLCMYDDVSELC